MTRRPAVVANVWLTRALIAFGAVVLLSWFTAPSLLGPQLLGGIPTKPAAAAGFLLLGVALASQQAPWRRRCALVLVAVIALLVIGAAATGHASVFATSLYLDRWRPVTVDGSGKLALGTALGLLAAAAAIAVAPRSGRWATALAALVFADGYVALVGHLYGASSLYQLQTATGMAAPTGVALLVSALAIATSRPNLVLVRVLNDPNTAGILVRRLLPWAVLLPPVVGWLHLAGVERGWFGTSYGVALMVLVYATSTLVAVFLGARTAARVDQQRQQTADALAALNEELTDRVEAAVAQSRAERERVSLLLDSIPVGVFETGPDGARRYVNERWREMTGVAGSAVADEWTTVLHPDDRERVRQEWSDAVASGQEYASRYRYLRPEGGVRWVDTISRTMRDASGRVTGWLGSVTDVTDQLQSQAALRRSEERFRLAMRHAPIGMAIVSLAGRFIETNEAMATITRYDKEALLGKTFQQITHPDDLDADEEQARNLLDGSISHYQMEKRYLCRDGETVWVLLSVSLVRHDDGSPAYFISQVQDISDARAAQERLVHRALHDPLTGLANRELIHDRLEVAIARATRTGDGVGVLFCDLDHFKDVNDTHGHEVGDAVLRAVAERFRRSVRPADTVGRLGGDEFVVVIEDVADDRLVVEIVRRIQEELRRPVRVDGLSLRVRASIGAAQGNGRDARAMLHEADEALYRAKAAGRDRFELFHSSLG